MSEQCIRYKFIRFVSVLPYYEESAYIKLAVSDGWAKVGNACIVTSESIPLFYFPMYRKSLILGGAHQP